MKETLIGLPILAILAGIIWATIKYEALAKGLLIGLLIVCAMGIAYWLGSMVLALISLNNPDDE